MKNIWYLLVPVSLMSGCAAFLLLSLHHFLVINQELSVWREKTISKMSPWVLKKCDEQFYPFYLTFIYIVNDLSFHRVANRWNNQWIKKKSCVANLFTHDNNNNLELTPEFIVICAALGLSTAVTHLTAILFIVYAKTEVFPLGQTQAEHNMNYTD